MTATVLVFAEVLAALAPGAKLFQQNCVVCHQAQGQGTTNIIPPLADHLGDYVGKEGGRAFLVHVVISGFQGAIEVNGKKYQQMMPSFTHLADPDVAAVLNFVMVTFNKNLLPKDWRPFTVEEVARLRPAKKLSPREVMREREGLVAKEPAPTSTR